MKTLQTSMSDCEQASQTCDKNIRDASASFEKPLKRLLDKKYTIEHGMMNEIDTIERNMY